MKKLVLSGLGAVALTFSMNAMAANFVEGKDYTVVANPGKTVAPAGQYEVREFFWYGCGHCYNLEPHMQTWLKKIPKDVYFLRTPAAMNKVWEQGARGYYVSEALGVRKRTHIPLFHAIHEGVSRSLTKPLKRSSLRVTVCQNRNLIVCLTLSQLLQKLRNQISWLNSTN